jgi:hypothetical protein
MQEIGLHALIPDFYALLTACQSSQAFQLSDWTAVFVLILLLLAGFASVYTLFKTARVFFQLRSFTNLLSQIADSSLALDLAEFSARLTKMRRLSNIHLRWTEFFATFIEVKNQNSPKCIATLSADEFFNTETLASSIIENRVLSAVPSFLTAIGVLGTFIGLTLGLSELSLTETADIQEMKHGLSHVIAGAKVAFISSVWGVMLSVAFNALEKTVSHWLSYRIMNLQIYITSLFPRVSTDASLQQLVESSIESKELLSVVGETIGAKLQETMKENSAALQESIVTAISEALPAALEKITDSMAASGQQSFEKLLDTFLEKFQNEGREQKDILMQLSNNTTSALHELHAEIKAYTATLEINSQEALRTKTQFLQEVQTNFTSFQEEILNQTAAVLQKIAESNSGLREEQTETLQQISNYIRTVAETADSASARTVELLESLSSASSVLVESSLQTTVIFEKIQHAILDLEAASTKNSDEISKLLADLAEATQITISQTEDALKLQATFAEASQTLSEAAEASVQIAEKTNSATSTSIAALQQISIESLSVCSTLQQSAEISSRMYDGLKISAEEAVVVLRRELEETVQSLANEVSGMLSAYATQTREQTRSTLDTWAGHTSEYSEKMKDLALSLEDVLTRVERLVTQNLENTDLG